MKNRIIDMDTNEFSTGRSKNFYFLRIHKRKILRYAQNDRAGLLGTTGLFTALRMTE
jgi:hypothetical protein